MTDIDRQIHDILRDVWGYDSFRPAQREIITSYLSGRDTIGLLPTGGGKSITFQVPALATEGLTVVITPLISLMRDQVDNLAARGVKAVDIHSGLTYRESRLAYDRAFLGKAKLLYLSPEKLQSPQFAQMLRQLPIARIVVDEAHCISQWGYDFRPSYLAIGQLRKLFPHAPLLALTASATPQVLDDIADKLAMDKPAVYRLSFNRPNISYIVRHTDDKYRKLLEILNNVPGCAIVYVRSRRRTREIAQMLEMAGISADFYHAGISPEEKTERQRKWKRGEVRVIVATNAFGMGIDNPNVRIVVHVDLPSSLEEYYQEAGRAGRDGEPSYAVLLCSQADKATLTRRLRDSFPPKDFIRDVYEKAAVFLGVAMGDGYDSILDFNFTLFCQRFGLNPTHTDAALKILTQAGRITYSDDTIMRPRLMMTVTKSELYDLQINEAAERVLQAVLRTYPGLFADYVYINEGDIARQTSMSEMAVYEALLALGRAHVLHYVPKRMSPYIHYHTSREPRSSILIPFPVYEDRMKQMKQRLDAMRDYAFGDDSCRSNKILRYFGEKPVEPCGHCDVCRAAAARKKDHSRLDYTVWCLICAKREMDVTEIPSLLKISAERAGDALRRLAMQGCIDIDGMRVTPTDKTPE